MSSSCFDLKSGSVDKFPERFWKNDFQTFWKIERSHHQKKTIPKIYISGNTPKKQTLKIIFFKNCLPYEKKILFNFACASFEISLLAIPIHFAIGGCIEMMIVTHGLMRQTSTLVWHQSSSPIGRMDLDQQNCPLLRQAVAVVA